MADNLVVIIYLLSNWLSKV